MNEMDLLKVIIHKLVQIERNMIKREDITELIHHLESPEEQVELIQEALMELKMSVEQKHIENINSDELLLRSIRQT
ncbi:hypothetical protein QA612_04075 [Evansella sp. AB-P1]|uniref:hypothetical protein n=1 Tax=Evansella sp. AB-P1 TaxID=3037653 RepID=UPI00241F751D|nr:hypothetical protein [Evansella sp. AB-P1]MDG5786657.1 hypothetical protein [Evansella sp. AB-P1]